MKLSNNFELSEFTASLTAYKNDIQNEPNDSEKLNLCLLVGNVMQPLRYELNEPIKITSGFRSELLNYLIGGSKTSDHVNGNACDFKCKNMNLAFSFIKKYYEFDQLIWEFGNEKQPDWIHVSYKSEGNRMQVLKAVKDNGRTKYINLNIK